MTAHLLSMADIARLSGQSRSTVGNWKARHADFPLPVSRTSRGPLYARDDVEDWLRRTGRTIENSENPAPDTATNLHPSVTRTAATAFSVSDAATVLLFLSLRLVSDFQQWQKISELADTAKIKALRQLATTAVPDVDGLVDWQNVEAHAGQLPRLLLEIAAQDHGRLPKLIDAEVVRCALGASGTPLHQPPRNLVLIPAPVRSLMAALLEVTDSDTLYQAGPGLGQALISAVSGRAFTGAMYLQESTSLTAQLARANLFGHGLTAMIKSGDVLASDAFSQLRADRVIATPPWDPKIPTLVDGAADPRWRWGDPGTNEAYLAWVQHSLFHLADGGRAVVLLPQSALLERGRSASIRGRIFKAGHIEGVISLPAGAIPGTSMRGALLVLVETPNDYTRDFPTMLDMSISPDGSPQPDGIPTPELAAHTADIYLEAAGGMPAEAFNYGTAGLETLAANDFVLDPGRYVEVGGPVSSIEQMMTNFGSMRLKLQTLAKRCRAADDDVQRMLGMEL
jgi:hypothetical protein